MKMNHSLLSGHAQSEQAIDAKIIEKLSKLIVDLKALGPLKVGLNEEIEMLEESLNSNSYLGHMEKLRRLEAAQEVMRTFNIYPDSTARHYLKSTSASKSVNEALAADWRKVGDQMRLSLAKSTASLSK